MQDEDLTNSDMDWKNRLLCSDESCIGTIGPNGRCTECGKAYEGKLPPLGSDAGLQALDEEDWPEESTLASQTDDATEGLDEFDGDWADRILCSDENCIGVIGPDGRCKECGKPRA